MKIPQTKRYSIYKNLVLQDKKSEKLNFSSDGREHYVYRITDYTRDVEEHYYGSHTPEKGKKYISLEEEFWTYKTSSKYNIINENKKEQYKIKILKVFDNPADKMLYEAFLHQYFNVKLNSSFWNQSNQTAFSFDRTGVEHSDDTKTLMSINSMGIMLGYKHTSKTKEKLSLCHADFTGSKNPFYGKKHSPKTIDKLKNRTVSSETRERMSKSRKGKNVSDIVRENLLYYSKLKPNKETKERMSKAQCSEIEIYNEQGKLILVSDKKFEVFCSLNKIPCSLFQASYRNNGKKILQTSKAIKRISKPEYIKYKGWYALKK